MIVEGNAPAFTIPQQKEADEWKAEVRKAEEKYRSEIAEAENDPDRRRALIRQIFGETGPAPELCRSGYGIPASWIEAELIMYRETVSAAPEVQKDGEGWVCSICGEKNTGNFCHNCGAKRQY